MSLKDLPDYLDSLRERGESDDSLVVDMGMIVEKPNYFKRVSFATIICLFLLVGGVATYNFIPSNNVIVVANSDAEKGIVSAMIVENGGTVVDYDQGTYRVKLNKFKNATLFLEKLRSNKLIKQVELEN